MINKTLADKLFSFFQRYLAFYKVFLQLENDKYNDLSHNIISTLDEYVKTEQAYMLKSKGMEIERDKLVMQTDSPKATFCQLIPLFDPPMQDQIKEIYDELSQVLLDFKETNQRCNQLIALKLHKNEINLHKLEKYPDLQKRYNSHAHEGHVCPSMLSKKI